MASGARDGGISRSASGPGEPAAPLPRGPRDKRDLVAFAVDDLRLALAIDRVERVLLMAAVDPLPGAPESVLGVLNVAGEAIPIVDPRPHFDRGRRPPTATDRLLLARSARRRLGLFVDDVTGVLRLDATTITEAARLSPGAHRLAGVATLPDGLLLIQDLDAFLSDEEERELDSALQSGPTPP